MCGVCLMVIEGVDLFPGWKRDKISCGAIRCVCKRIVAYLNHWQDAAVLRLKTCDGFSITENALVELTLAEGLGLLAELLLR